MIPKLILSILLIMVIQINSQEHVIETTLINELPYYNDQWTRDSQWFLGFIITGVSIRDDGWILKNEQLNLKYRFGYVIGGLHIWRQLGSHSNDILLSFNNNEVANLACYMKLHSYYGQLIGVSICSDSNWAVNMREKYPDRFIFYGVEVAMRCSMLLLKCHTYGQMGDINKLNQVTTDISSCINDMTLDLFERQLTSGHGINGRSIMDATLKIASFAVSITVPEIQAIKSVADMIIKGVDSLYRINTEFISRTSTSDKIVMVSHEIIQQYRSSNELCGKHRERLNQVGINRRLISNDNRLAMLQENENQNKGLRTKNKNKNKNKDTNKSHNENED